MFQISKCKATLAKNTFRFPVDNKFIHTLYDSWIIREPKKA